MKGMDESKKAFLELHISILLAGCTGLFGKLISLNEGYLTFWRLFFTFIIILLYLLCTKKLVKIKGADIAKTLLAGACIGLHWLFFYGSIKYSNISVGIVCLSLISLFTAIIDPIVNNHRYFKHEFIFSMVAVMGIIFIFNFDANYRTGIILGVISAIFAALFTIVNKKVVKYNSSSVLFYEMTGGLICISLFLPFYVDFSAGAQFLPSGTDFFYLFILALFCTVFLYYFQISSLKKLSAFCVNLSYNLEPLYTFILAILLFSENKDLTSSFYIGFALIFSSVILQSIYVLLENKRKKIAETI